MQAECSSPSFGSEFIGLRWSFLDESVDDLVPVRVHFNRHLLTVAPTYQLMMSLNGEGAMQRKDRGGGIIYPSSFPSSEDPDLVGVSAPPPFLHCPVGNAPGLFSLFSFMYLLIGGMVCLLP
jgi:hypothetical protein